MNSLSFREIKAWSDLRQIELLDWELDAIIALDIKRRAVAAHKPDENGATPGPGKMADLFPALRVKRVTRSGQTVN